MEQSITSAIHKGFFQQIRYLIEFGQSLDERDFERRTPLMCCALIKEESWGVGLARVFIEKGASMGLRDKWGLNALHYACMYERDALANVLLGAVDYNINQGDRQGNTPLHYAVARGSTALTRILVDAIRRYKLSANKPNTKGITPLVQAWKSGHPECARILVQKGEVDDEGSTLVEGKTVKEWEEEYWRKKQWAEHVDREPHRPKTAQVRSMAARSLRPHSAFNRKSLGALHKRQRLDLSSDALLGRYERCKNGNKSETDMLEKGTMALCLLRSASLNDLRNTPEKTFHVSAMDCFVSDGHQPSHPPQHRERTQTDSEKSAGTGSWKADLQKFYSDQSFQFSSAYKKSARPPELYISLSEYGIDGRGPSPNPSDCHSESVSDRMSINSRASKMGSRRISSRAPSTGSLTPESGKPPRKISASLGKIGRRPSFAQAPPALKTQLENPNFDVVNSANASKANKKRPTSSSSEPADDMSSDDKSSKADRVGSAKGASRARKTSDPGDPPASPGRTILKGAPLKEPNLQPDQLGPIQE